MLEPERTGVHKKGESQAALALIIIVIMVLLAGGRRGGRRPDDALSGRYGYEELLQLLELVAAGRERLDARRSHPRASACCAVFAASWPTLTQPSR